MDHVRLVCFECGLIEEYRSPLFKRLKDEISRETGFRIRNAWLDAGGRCASCCASGRGGTGCKVETGRYRIDVFKDRVPPISGSPGSDDTGK